MRWARRSATNRSGDRFWDGENAPRGVVVRYRLGAGLTEAQVACRLERADGEVIHEFEPPHAAGVHTLTFAGRRGRFGGGGLAIGDYTVVLRVQDTELRRSFSVHPDPSE